MKRYTFFAAALLTACSYGGGMPAHSGLSNPADPAPNSYLQRKMAIERQPLRSAFVAKKHPGFIPQSRSTTAWPTGITQAGELPVPGGMFDITNQYDDTANGRHVTVYAGALRTTGAGIVLIVSRSADLHVAKVQLRTVAGSAVRIESASNGQLQLRTMGTTPQSVEVRAPS